MAWVNGEGLVEGPCFSIVLNGEMARGVITKENSKEKNTKEKLVFLKVAEALLGF